MKNLFAIVCLFTVSHAFGQSKMYTKTGNVQFEASVPAFEEVKAENENVTAVLQADTGALAALVLVKGFRFKNALMEEHFNENYMDSDTYPKATFKGSITGFNLNDVSASAKALPVKGTLNIHGVSKEVQFNMDVNTTSNGIHLSAELKVKPADFKIKIPGIVKEKIAEDVVLTLSFDLSAK